MTRHEPTTPTSSTGPPAAAGTAGGRRLVALDPDSPAPGWMPELWNARQLMATDFPAPRWAVPGIICEGLSLLAGPPKVGKSWLSLGLALSVAGGGPAFGKIPVRSGPVLYLALEDTPRRLKARLGQLLTDSPTPDGLDIATDWPPMPAGGDIAIAAWLDAHRAARLVVIDVFAKVRGATPPGVAAYDADYTAVSRIKRIADNYAVAVVLVHHVRKAASEDFLQEVSGTNGIAGAADATLVLKRPRGQADGVLHVTGRDVEETEIAMSRDRATGHWHALDGSVQEHAMHETRTLILRHTRASGPATPKAIAEALDLSHDVVKKTCQRMAAAGQLRAYPGGRYEAPDPGGTPPLPGLAPDPGVPAVPPVPEVPWRENGNRA